MVSKEELKQKRSAFYNALNERMKIVQSARGGKVNWLNYPLQLKETYFRLEFDDSGARMCVDLQHRDIEIRKLFWEQWQELKKVMQSQFEDPFVWKEKHQLADTDFVSSRIMLEQPKLDFYNEKDWPEALDFFDRNLRSFDAFWIEFRDAFKALS